LLHRLWRRHRRGLDRRHGGSGKFDIGLGGLGRDIDLVLADLAVALGRHLVAGALVRYHLRERLRLRRVLLMVLRRCRRPRRLVRLLIRLLVLRLRRRCLLRCESQLLRRRLRWLRLGHHGLLRDLRGRLGRRLAGGLGRGNAIVNEAGLGRPAFHAELVFGRGMVSAVGTEHRYVNGG